jgi:membrane protein required for colicin V production
MGIAPLDWVFLAVMAASFLLGAWRGLVYEVLSLFSWVAAFILAQWFAPDVARWLPMGDAPAGVRYAAGFVLVFIGVVFAGGLVSWLIKKMVEAVGLRPVDRALGAAFGLIRGAVLLLALAVVVNLTSFSGADWWMESKGAAVSMAALRQLKPVLPDRFGEYLPS